ncbi:GIY-YIG nuclease family protein [Parachlamydia acanthamoebae]|uniref:GIY-YIG nuclease family protein n=1 Tax=Parachlamydia acanthamoebae TaxID=83552 RepID=UPI0024E2157E|nr:GIY-YIG nuclease family protein [Parachlamydia acanthamoebae]
METVTNQILKKETELIAKEAGYAVYRCVQANSTIYVGITNNFIRRSAEHLSKKNMLIHQLIGGLTKMEARGVEQALINYHGFISSSNPAYTIQLQKGYELLKSIGYI